MDIRWSDEKNEVLKRERGLSFEEAAEIIKAGEELDVIPHPYKVEPKNFGSEASWLRSCRTFRRRRKWNLS
jgi:hypothetical protein